ncbi:transcriptional repressor CTCFL-like [Gordionus sp. m RMFG-2023]|uniref:transcriptional repressor CTCFL-like n=1 Tax=Gordionus sp. m RMFG-2023 TaxID=3053472 RepID=UPI0031FD2408
MNLAKQENNYMVMSEEEATKYVTQLAEDACTKGDYKPISISAYTTEGIYQSYSLIPTNNEEEYMLLISQQPQQNLNIENIKQSPQNHPKSLIDLFNEMEQEGIYDTEQLRKIRIILPQKRGRRSNQDIDRVSSAPNVSIDKMRFTCAQCAYSSNRKSIYEKHLLTHRTERPFQCHFCEKAFKTQVALKQHINSHEGKKPNKCTDCTSAFTTPGELHRHIKYIHTHEKPHKCTECNYASVEYSKLRRHMQAHLGFKPYACPHCSYRSVDNFKLKRHLRIHTGERPYKCDICQSSFNQRTTLKMHILTHSTEKPKYKCHLCPSTCGRKTDLRVHFQTLHNCDIPILCKKCGKFFPDRYTHKEHARTHKGEKCFKCELCSYATHLRQNLDMHMLVHTNQKPIVCKFCDKRFKQKSQMTKHMEALHIDKEFENFKKAKMFQDQHINLGMETDDNQPIFESIDVDLSSSVQPLNIYNIMNPENLNESIKGKNKYCCQHCSNVYTTKCRLTNHIRTTHFKKKVAIQQNHEKRNNEIDVLPNIDDNIMGEDMIKFSIKELSGLKENTLIMILENDLATTNEF